MSRIPFLEKVHDTYSEFIKALQLAFPYGQRTPPHCPQLTEVSPFPLHFLIKLGLPVVTESGTAAAIGLTLRWGYRHGYGRCVFLERLWTDANDNSESVTLDGRRVILATNFFANTVVSID